MNLRGFGCFLPLAMMSACAPQAFRVEAGPAFVQNIGKVSLQNSAGSLDLGSVQHRFDGDLALDDVSAAPYLRGEWESNRHNIRLHGFGFHSNGSGTLTAPYGDIPSGTAVETSMDFYSIASSYTYDVWTGKWLRLGLGGQLSFLSLDVSARSGVNREAVNSNVLAPMPFAELELFKGPFSFALDAGIMSADLGDANGRYVDFEAMARWQATSGFDVIGGYRMLVADVAGRASDRDFDADFYAQGWFIGGGIRF